MLPHIFRRPPCWNDIKTPFFCCAQSMEFCVFFHTGGCFLDVCDMTFRWLGWIAVQWTRWHELQTMHCLLTRKQGPVGSPNPGRNLPLEFGGVWGTWQWSHEFPAAFSITQVYGESSVWEQTHEDQGNRGIGEVIGAWNILLAVASIQHFFLFNQWVIFRNGGTICVSICGRFLKWGMPPKPWVSILKGLILDHLKLWAPIF